MKTKNVNETGHAKNVANFERMIVFCTAYGTSYNPSTAAIKLTALNALLTASRTSMSNVAVAMSAYSNAIAARKIAFEPLSKLSGRIVYSLASTGIAEVTVNNARTHLRKIQGRRAKALPNNGNGDTPSTPDNTTTPNGDTHVSVSASQMSYDNRLENFNRLVELVASEAVYSPNEIDLKVTAIKATLANLKSLNTAAFNATTQISNARLSRNKTLYAPSTGMLSIVYEVKNYVRSVFGINSGEYKQISGLPFTYFKL